MKESLYYFSVVTLAPLFILLLFVVLDYLDRKRRRALKEKYRKENL